MSDVYDKRADELIRKELPGIILSPEMQGRLHNHVKGWLQSGTATDEVVATKFLEVYREGLNDGVSIASPDTA